MKHLFTLTLLIALAQFGFSQSACDNWNSIQGKTESELTDIKRLKIYWSKRCACESGQITGGDWDYTVRLVNENYDMYHERRNKFPSEYSYNGALVPDRKISVNDCNSDNSLHINDSGTTNCGKKAFDANKDPQNYGNDFMRARCQCLEGVPFEEDAKKLEATMKINFQNAQTYYGNTLGMPQPLAWTECPILQLGQGANTQNSSPALVYTGRESDLDKLKDQYLETFSTRQSFSAYVSGENIKRIGVTMAKDFADNLNSIGSLVETTDPVALQQDYLQKMSSIENLEAQFNEESNTYFFESGQQLGGSIMNKDYETAMFQAGGLLNAHLERKEAEKELAKQKAELEKAYKAELWKVYKKAKEFNRINRLKFLKFAAYSTVQEQEEYYLEMVESLLCHKEKIWPGYQQKSVSMMINNTCPKPTLEESNAIENKFLAKDVKLSQIAEHKYQIFLETGFNEFRDAAISFASTAAHENPQAKYFAQIAKYYENYSAILELNNYLTAMEFEPDYFSNSEVSKINSLRSKVEFEVQNAVHENNLEYIKSFLKLGLENVIFIDAMHLKQFVLTTDQPDILQIIMNEEVEGMSDQEVKTHLREAIILCATYNSDLCIERFISLGVETNFEIKGTKPIEVAEKMLSQDAYRTLLVKSNEKEHFIEHHKNSPIHILITAESNPVEAGKTLESIIHTEDFSRVVDRMISQLNTKKYVFESLGASQSILNYVHTNESIKNHLLVEFNKQLYRPFNISNSHLFIKHNLLKFEKMPRLYDLGMNESKPIIRLNSQKSFKWALKNGSWKQYFDPTFDTLQITPETSLVYASYLLENPLLFHELDEKYNLSEIVENGKTLFHLLLTEESFTSIDRFYKISVALAFWESQYISKVEHINAVNSSSLNAVDYYRLNPITGVELNDFECDRWNKSIDEEYILLLDYVELRKFYYSEDFDFNKKINGEYPIFILLNSSLKHANRLGVFNYHTMFELSEIIEKYPLNGNITDQNGNTLLHWMAENLHLMTEESPNLSIYATLPDLKTLNKFAANKTVKNNNGDSPYKKWKNILTNLSPSHNWYQWKAITRANINYDPEGINGPIEAVMLTPFEYMRLMLK